MSANRCFQRGEVVIHSRRPEWGRGVVKDAQPITHQGAPAQRLVVDFIHQGRVVLNTAVAPLALKENAQEMSHSITSSAPDAERGWLSRLEKAAGNGSHELWSLPQSMTDPFLSPARRLEATLESYRFTTEPRSLIEWAAAQTGLDDPLSKYTRHELEQAFPRFARDRDQHLQGLVRQIKRSGESHLLEQAAAKTRLPAARAALTKAMRG